MAIIKGQSYVVRYMAWDTTTTPWTPKTGDASNHTVYLDKDTGSSSAISVTITEIDSTNRPGEYKFQLSSSHTNADSIGISIKSSTSGVYIQPITLLTEKAYLSNTWDRVSYLMYTEIDETYYAVYSYLLAGENNVINSDLLATSAVNEIAGGILSNPSNKLATDSQGRVTVATNADKTGYSLTEAERSSIATSVWSATTRTLTSFGTLASDVASAVWSAGSRTLTSFGSLVSDIWSHTSRTLTGFGTLASDVAAAVWGYTIEASQTALAWMRLVGSVLFGKRTVNSGNVAYRDWNDTKNRVTGTEDSEGNRTISSRDGS